MTMIVDVGGLESRAWIDRVCLRSVGSRTQIVIHVEYTAGILGGGCGANARSNASTAVIAEFHMR